MDLIQYMMLEIGRLSKQS